MTEDRENELLHEIPKMNETNKFTPGPWRVAGGGRCVVEAEDGTLITNTWSATNDGPWQANARLIASAPALYEAAKELLATYPVNKTFQPKTPEETRMANAVKLAIAALDSVDGSPTAEESK